MTPTSGILRDWSSNDAPDSDRKVEGTMETPVVATLVETIPRIYRQGNVFFQSAYDQFGQHFTQSNRTICSPSDRILRTIPSSRNEFLIEDVDDTGEYQFINGEMVRIISVGDKYDDEDYDQAFHNRPGPARRLRNLLSRRGAKGKECNRGGVRERKGSRDKKFQGRKQKNYRNTPNNFPIPANASDNRGFSPNDIRLPFETLCTKADKSKERSYVRGSAPFSQRMSRSRAATNAMNEINIYSDCEVSDLGTDIERDPLSLSHVNSDTDIDFASSFENSITSPPSKEEETSSHSRKISFINVIQEAKNLLETEFDESEVENDTDTEVVVNGRWTPAKAKSLPNLNGSRKRYVQEETNRVNVDHRVREYESRLQHVQKLYVSKVLTPPRKARPQSSEESDKGSPLVSTPPQVAFKHLSSHSPARVRNVTVPRRRSRETYNNTLKILFVGSPNSGKTSLINALVKKNKKLRKSRKSVDLNIETWSPAPINGDRQTKFNLWDLPGGNVESGAHHVSSIFFMLTSY